MNSKNGQTQRTIEKVVDKFLLARTSEGRKPRTIDWYEDKLNILIRYFENRDFEGITVDEMREFQYSISLKHNPGGAAGIHRAYKALFNWYENEYDPRDWMNPARRIKKPKVPNQILDPVSQRDLNKLLSVCGDDWHGTRDRAIIMVLNGTGMRSAELLGLDVADLDLPISTLYIRESKNGDPRAVDFDKATKRAMKAYMSCRDDIRGNDPAPQFITSWGNRMTYDILRQLLNRRSALAGVEPVKAHGFRRKHALDLFREGWSKLKIQYRLGQRTGASLDRYIKYSAEDLRLQSRRKRN